MTDPKWELAHEYGQGCRVYVDANSLTVNGDIVRAQVRHYLVPPGTDKRNQRPIQEMLIEKEFDLGRGRARYHSITFTYVGGELAAPLLTEAEWADADKGTLVALNFVRTLISPKKKRWWLLYWGFENSVTSNNSACFQKATTRRGRRRMRRSARSA